MTNVNSILGSKKIPYPLSIVKQIICDGIWSYDADLKRSTQYLNLPEETFGPLEPHLQNPDGKHRQAIVLYAYIYILSTMVL